MIDTRNHYRAVKSAGDRYWRVSFRRWWWPQWFAVCYCADNLAEAVEYAKEHATRLPPATSPVKVYLGRFPLETA